MIDKRTRWLQFRADERLVDAIHIHAAANFRSFNEQILAMLHDWFKRENERICSEMPELPGPQSVYGESRTVNVTKRKEKSA